MFAYIFGRVLGSYLYAELYGSLTEYRVYNIFCMWCDLVFVAAHSQTHKNSNFWPYFFSYARISLFLSVMRNVSAFAGR